MPGGTGSALGVFQHRHLRSRGENPTAMIVSFDLVCRLCIVSAGGRRVETIVLLDVSIERRRRTFHVSPHKEAHVHGSGG
jgi:hypothetical protein